MRKALARFAWTCLSFALGIAMALVWSDRRRPDLAWAAAGQPAKEPSAGSAKVQRFGSVIGVRAEKLDDYVKLHANPWPEVMRTIKECNIRNYSIYLGKLDDGKLYLFSYFEYVGRDFDADMKKMAADPKTREWWTHTDPCQIPLAARQPGEHWMTIKEVFHTD